MNHLAFIIIVAALSLFGFALGAVLYHAHENTLAMVAVGGMIISLIITWVGYL